MPLSPGGRFPGGIVSGTTSRLLSPLHSDFRRSAPRPPADWEKFRGTLERRGRARLVLLHAEPFTQKGDEHSTGPYVATRRSPCGPAPDKGGTCCREGPRGGGRHRPGAARPLFSGIRPGAYRPRTGSPKLAGPGNRFCARTARLRLHGEAAAALRGAAAPGAGAGDHQRGAARDHGSSGLGPECEAGGRARKVRVTGRRTSRCWGWARPAPPSGGRAPPIGPPAGDDRRDAALSTPSPRRPERQTTAPPSLATLFPELGSRPA